MEIDVTKITTKDIFILGSKTKGEAFFYLQFAYNENEVLRKKQLFQSHGFDYYVKKMEIPFFHGSV